MIATWRAAALFSRTSSAMDRAFHGDPLENAAPFLVEPGVASEDAVFEQPSGLGHQPAGVRVPGSANGDVNIALSIREEDSGRGPGGAL